MPKRKKTTPPAAGAGAKPAKGLLDTALDYLESTGVSRDDLVHANAHGWESLWKQKILAHMQRSGYENCCHLWAKVASEGGAYYCHSYTSVGMPTRAFLSFEDKCLCEHSECPGGCEACVGYGNKRPSTCLVAEDPRYTFQSADAVLEAEAVAAAAYPGLRAKALPLVPMNYQPVIQAIHKMVPALQATKTGEGLGDAALGALVWEMSKGMLSLNGGSVSVSMADSCPNTLEAIKGLSPTAAYDALNCTTRNRLRGAMSDEVSIHAWLDRVLPALQAGSCVCTWDDCASKSRSCVGAAE